MSTAFFQHIRSQIVKLLNDSKVEVCVAMAWFTSAELYESLLECCKRGVSVRLVLLNDSINWMPFAPDFNILKNAGAEIRLFEPSTKFMHNKFCVIDNEKVITGSYNWTYYAEIRNLENILVSSDSLLVSQYLAEFIRIWECANQDAHFQRLSFSDICEQDDVNFVELNQELEIISQVRHEPKQVVVKAVMPKIEIIEKTRTPKCGIYIGFEDKDGKMNTLIPKNVNLPYESSCNVFSYEDVRKDISLKLLVGESEIASECYILSDNSLSDIVDLANMPKLNIEISVRMEMTGYVMIDIECKESKKAIRVTHSLLDTVIYE